MVSFGHGLRVILIKQIRNIHTRFTQAFKVTDPYFYKSPKTFVEICSLEKNTSLHPILKQGFGFLL